MQILKQITSGVAIALGLSVAAIALYYGYKIAIELMSNKAGII